jgi:hypothetical protein
MAPRKSTRIKGRFARSKEKDEEVLPSASSQEERDVVTIFKHNFTVCFAPHNVSRQALAVEALPPTPMKSDPSALQRAVQSAARSPSSVLDLNEGMTEDPIPSDHDGRPERIPKTVDCSCGTTALATPVPLEGIESALGNDLQVLSSVFLTTTNALADQIKYLPDSCIPPADFSYDGRGEESSEVQVGALRREFDYLLWDTAAMQRADFLAVPKEVLELLRGVWNLSGDSEKVDKIAKRLVPVQSFFPNLLNYLLRSPGFPTVTDTFDSELFKSFGAVNVRRIETLLSQAIRQSLEDMGYPCGDDISFYLSFMKTNRRTVVQDPHIDFKWEAVDQWLVNESPTRRRTKRGRKLDYKERVPFIAFFPLTPDGMAVEFWQARYDHEKGRSGVLVHIPFGCLMIARGDVVHAGGFSNSQSGNSRCHLYIYRAGGEVHDLNTSNTYTREIDGKGAMRMSQLYKHGPGI